jgi:ankyrin repeat protein
MSALYYACMRNHPAVVKALCNDSRVNVNTMSDAGTPLHSSCDSDSVDCTEILLAHKDIDINAQAPYDGWTALMRAANHNCQNCLELLLKRNDIQINLKGKFDCADKIEF